MEVPGALSGAKMFVRPSSAYKRAQRGSAVYVPDMSLSFWCVCKVKERPERKDFKCCGRSHKSLNKKNLYLLMPNNNQSELRDFVRCHGFQYAKLTDSQEMTALLQTVSAQSIRGRQRMCRSPHTL